MTDKEIQNKSHLLIAESPLLIFPSLAKCVGVNEAIFLQQLHFWMSQKSMGRFVDGRKWIFNTVDRWIEDNFPFWSRDQLMFITKKLANDGLLLKRDDLNELITTKSLWYSIDYNRLNSLIDEGEPLERVKRGKSIKSKNLPQKALAILPLSEEAKLQVDAPQFCRSRQSNFASHSKNTITKNTDKENTTFTSPQPSPIPTSTKQNFNGDGEQGVDMANNDLENEQALQELQDKVAKLKALVNSKKAKESPTPPIDKTKWTNDELNAMLKPLVADTMQNGRYYDDLYGKPVVVDTQDHLVNTNKMIADQFPDTGNMIAPKTITNHFPDTSNMVVTGNDVKHIGNVNKMVSTGNQASPLPLGFAMPLPNTQNMANNASNEQKRNVGQNSAVSKPVKPLDKPTKPTVAKQPDLAQAFLERWCEEVLGYQIPSTSWGREKRTAKALLTKGVDFETQFNDLAGSYRYMKQKPYCADRHVFIQEVATNLPAWIQAGRPSSQVVAKPQWQVANDANDLLWNELVSLTGGVKRDGTRVPMKYGRNDANIAKSKMSKGLLALLQRMTANGRYSELLDMSDEQMEFAFKRAVKVVSKE